MVDLVRIVVGFDQREAVAYHAFSQSLIENSSAPLQLTPLSENNLPFFNDVHSDASNRFVYSRFLTPFLMDYAGWAIFADGDMVCRANISDLWSLRDDEKAVMVVKHDYKTKFSDKYLGNKNENYPRKNWSSVVLWNCGHPKNKILTPKKIASSQGSFLHRFQWLDDSEIGSLPIEWNWLASEYEDNSAAKIIHYTVGTPCFPDFSDAPMSDYWHENFKRLQEGKD
jgi:lipopolysaccharide biosynthesis glycosyltransferase